MCDVETFEQTCHVAPHIRCCWCSEFRRLWMFRRQHMAWHEHGSDRQPYTLTYVFHYTMWTCYIDGVLYHSSLLV